MQAHWFTRCAGASHDGRSFRQGLPKHPFALKPSVSKTIPNYLRVHRGPSHNASQPLADSKSLNPVSDSVSQFWESYTDATGWRIDTPDAEQPPKLLPALDFDLMGDIDELDDAPSVTKSSAEALAASAKAIASELDSLRDVVRRQAAELSTRAAIVSEETRDELAKAIQETLEAATVACQCDAAAICLLDDETEKLATRRVHNLPVERLAQMPRELRGSRGDLEAMVKGVIAINDVNLGGLDTWNCPEPASSAICAAIISAGVPIGTLWLYSSEPMQFDGSHEASAKLAASMLAMKLSAAVSNPKVESSKSTADISELAQWQFASLPTGTRLAPGWRVDGMIESPRNWATGWHTWDVLPDGSLMIAIAEAGEDSTGGAMTASIARAALAAHTSYRHSPHQLMQRISDTLWQTSTVDQLTSLLYARIDPETGEGEIVSAGDIDAIIGSRYGYRPVIAPSNEPLASRMDVNSNATTFRMMPGEVLLAHTSGIKSDGATQMMLGNRLKESMSNDDHCPLASVRQMLANVSMQHERGAISILRQA